MNFQGDDVVFYLYSAFLPIAPLLCICFKTFFLFFNESFNSINVNVIITVLRKSFFFFSEQQFFFVILFLTKLWIKYTKRNCFSINFMRKVLRQKNYFIFLIVISIHNLVCDAIFLISLSFIIIFGFFHLAERLSNKHKCLWGPLKQIKNRYIAIKQKCI